jgi:uncharacterized protein (TIGR03790 family)
VTLGSTAPGSPGSPVSPAAGGAGGDPASCGDAPSDGAKPAPNGNENAAIAIQVRMAHSLEQPLVKKLEQEKLFVFGPATNRYPEFKAADPSVRRIIDASIRYAVLCYGVPVKIQGDPTLNEEGSEKVPPELRRTEAAVDTQLALCPNVEQKLHWAGPLPSPFYGFTNASMMHPTNSLLMVTRLDGPSAAIARGLVDKAMEAETNGLWGRAYFDARGLATNDSYFLGDNFMHGAALAAGRFGFETELDNGPDTFSAGHPLSQIALYGGWYDQVVKGPFLLPTVEFMPGAFAYHLYSFSAQTIRSTENSWVGTLLAKGATCTMGAVDEPYLSGTPDLATFVGRLTFGGFTFGEAAYTAQGALLDTAEKCRIRPKRYFTTLFERLF